MTEQNLRIVNEDLKEKLNIAVQDLRRYQRICEFLENERGIEDMGRILKWNGIYREY